MTGSDRIIDDEDSEVLTEALPKVALPLFLPGGLAGVEAHRLEEQGGQPHDLTRVSGSGWSRRHATSLPGVRVGRLPGGSGPLEL
jgi:hypothetical protein